MDTSDHMIQESLEVRNNLASFGKLGSTYVRQLREKVATSVDIVFKVIEQIYT